MALPEAWRIFRKTVAHLRALADAGTLVLVICPTPAARLPDRDRLLDALIAEADKVIKLEVATLSLEKPVPVSVSPPNILSPKRLDRLPGLEYEPWLSLPLGKEDSMGIPTGTGSSNAPCIRIPVGGGILLSSPLRHDSRPL